MQVFSRIHFISSRTLEKALCTFVHVHFYSLRAEMSFEDDREGLRKISTTSSCPTEASFEPRRHRPPLWNSCRLNLALMCLAATLNFFLMRLNLSFALICMVRDQTNNHSHVENSSFHPVDVVAIHQDNKEALSSVHHQDDFAAVYTIGWDKEEQGNMLSAFYYGFCLTQIFGGWICDRIGGSKAILISMMAFMSLLSFISPLTAFWSGSAFFALRLGLGLASGLAMPTVQPLFARWSAPDERGTLIGLAFAGFSLGSSITFPLSGFLCQYGFAGGWPSIFYISGIMGAVWVVLAIFFIHDSPEIHPRIEIEELSYLEPYCMKKQNGKKYTSIPWRAILTSGPVNTINVCHFCLNWGFYTLISGLPIFMKEALKFDITQNGLLSSMPYAAALVAHLLSGKIFDWFRRKELCDLTTLRKIFNTIGFLIPAISIFVVTQLTFEWRYVAVVLLAVSQAGIEIAIMGGYLLSNIDLAPQFSGVMQGIANTVGTMPGFVSPIIMTYLTPEGTQSQWANVFYISAGLYLFGAILYLICGSSERQSWSRTVSSNANGPENLTFHPSDEIVPIRLVEDPSL